MKLSRAFDRFELVQPINARQVKHGRLTKIHFTNVFHDASGMKVVVIRVWTIVRIERSGPV